MSVREKFVEWECHLCLKRTTDDVTVVVVSTWLNGKPREELEICSSCAAKRQKYTKS